MKPATKEWVSKAEGDLLVATLAMRTRKDRKQIRDAVCYHCQQSAEKYLKGRLVEAGVAFPHTHDLERVLLLTLPLEPLWSALLPAAKFLTDCAVDFRYPGQTATEQAVKTAMRHCKVVRSEVRHSLGLK